MPQRTRRSKYTKEEIKKNREKLFGVNKKIVEQNQKRNSKRGVAFQSSKKESTSTKTTKLTGAERAKAMAKARIKAGKTINDLKIANKAAMKARAKARYEAFKKKRKK